MTSESSDGLRSPWLTRRELLESRTHPLDWLFVGLVGQWIFINFVLYPPYGRFLVQAGSLQRQMGPIFPVTYGCAIGIVLYGLYIFRRRYGLDVVRSGVYSIGLGLAATSLF